jgi:hypothetical protein
MKKSWSSTAENSHVLFSMKYATSIERVGLSTRWGACSGITQRKQGDERMRG